MIKKDKYEISLWQDEIVDAVGDIPEHYEEKKIAVIGSNTMTAQWRAVDPKLVENINGTNTFTFKLYYTYVDTETGEKKTNPFLNLLVNERKVKVLWKDKWYDLVIKSIQENSGDKSITYTCKDLFINELSKTGFELEFDNELMNNQGTVKQLADKVLEGTDWKVLEGDTILQKKEEPVYEATASGTLTPANGGDSISVSDAKVLAFYSDIQDKAARVQVLYAGGNNFETDGKASQLVINANNYYCSSESLTGLTLSDLYRGEKLVSSQKQIFDSVIDRYVSVYDYNGGKENVYGYSTTEYKDPTLVNNLLVNNHDFTSTEGWLGGNLVFQLYPAFDGTNISEYNSKSYLKLSGTVLNRGIYESSIYIPDGFQVGEQYIFRYKARTDSSGPTNTAFNDTIIPSVSTYIIDTNGVAVPTSTKIFTVGAQSTVDGWVEYIMSCSTSVTRNELVTGIKTTEGNQEIGFFLTINGTCWLEEAQFYPLVYGEGKRINPGEFDTLSVAQVVYKYYEANSALDKENIKYLYTGNEPWSAVTAVGNGFTKIRSITAKHSNRFNILQSLAETFECWAKFEIEHESNGAIKCYNEDGEYIGPQKKVRFVSEIGQHTGIGFVYGIDLKTIQRTINSDQIITKAIVSPNNNEFAKDGFCTIARSSENYSKENFILNFDYYITQGLLDGGTINRDLYLGTDNSIGYYYHLNKYNTKYDELTKELIERKKEAIKQESMLAVYQNQISAIAQQKQSIESELMALAGLTSIKETEQQKALAQYIKNNPDDIKVASLMQNRTALTNQLNSYQDQKGKLEDSHNKLLTRIEEIQTGNESAEDDLDKLGQEGILVECEKLHEKFYKKYSRFIQEGSWTSEEYIDDDIYYLDALSVAYTSSRPKITYNISVIRLSAIEEFKNKIFRLGDIAHIQDTEFFGYVTIEGVRTPYKEKVLVSEITSFFDSPEKDTFKIQNYKTQFEDLFQRITATTQSLQYASGEYAKAANAFTETGEIKVETLQNSFALNQQFVISAQNESIISDNTGITLSDTTNPNNKTKITSGGVFISVDGGKTWKNAIRGEGLSTQYLTAGSINANNIMILDGAHPTFRWDAQGINAFAQGKAGINTSIFTRFDQYGIYGIKGITNFVPKSEEHIWENAQFALTWKGFSLKNQYGNGYVQISSEEDFIVVDEKDIRRIQIGAIKNDNGQAVYGIVLRDEDGQTTLMTDDSGKLWLKDSLSVETYKENTNVAIGKLDTEDSKDSEHGGRIIDADNKFVVYEDGFMKATGAEVSGTIIADKGSTFAGTITAGSIIAGGGTIGNLTVDNVAQTIQDSKGIKITSEKGFSFKTSSNGVTTPDSITLELSGVGIDINTYQIEWQTATTFGEWAAEEEKGTALTIKPGNWDIYYVKATVYNNDDTEDKYTTWVTITNVKDGADGENTNHYEVEFSTEEIVQFLGTGNTITYSPNYFSFEVYNTKDGEKKPVNINGWGLGLKFCYKDNFKTERQYGDIFEAIELQGNNYRQATISNIFGGWEEYKENAILYEGVFKIIFTPPGEPSFVKVLNFRNGVSSDLATFNINASGFNSAVGGGKLSFSATGLEIFQKGIKIYKSSDTSEAVFEADDDGNLKITGEIHATSGVFNGTIHAIDGDFSGEIKATGGEIGGFTIENNRLISSNGGIELNGKDNKIIANVISLGTGANIVDYIALGEARLYNPSNHNGIVIQAGSNFYISQDGAARFGEMIVDNEGGLQSAVGQWSIDAEGNAIFDNIRANSCTIGTSILEINTVQAVGNTMIFKKAGRVIEINEDENGKENKLITDEQITVKTNDFVIVSCGTNKILTQVTEYTERKENTIIDDNTSQTTIVGSIITIKDSLKEKGFLPNETIITVLGQTGDFVFSINSDKYVPEGYDFLSPTALTLANINGEKFEKTLVLGNLNGLNRQYTDFGISGIGLYADNVYLNGTLTTKVQENSYAGVNTLSGTNAEFFKDVYVYIKSVDSVFIPGEEYYELDNKNNYVITTDEIFDGSKTYYKKKEDTSRIVFWAGSRDATSIGIQNAPFQVTEMGSIYASQGKFTGSVIANSIISQTDIYGAKIYTAEIHGWDQNAKEGKGASSSLSIYDSSNGIIFKSEANNAELFRINSSGLGLSGQSNFISINNKTSNIRQQYWN